MNDNFVKTIDYFTSEYEEVETIMRKIDIDTLVRFWLDGFNFDGKYKDCKIRSYDYGFNFEQNKIIFNIELIKKKEKGNANKRKDT